MSIFGFDYAVHYRIGAKPHSKGPLLVFVDGINQLMSARSEQPETIASPWEDAQRTILEPLALQSNTLTFCFSHAPLEWISSVVRETNGIAVDLDVMTPDEVHELMVMHDLVEFTPFVNDVSQGHPRTIQYLLLTEPGLLRNRDLPTSTPSTLSRVATAIDALPSHYRDLLSIVGVLRVVDIPTMEFLLEKLCITELNDKPVTSQALRNAIIAFGTAGLFEDALQERHTRFVASLRRYVQSELPVKDLQIRLTFLSEYYEARIFSDETHSTKDRLSALREWLYVQTQLVATSQHNETDLRPAIDNICEQVNQLLDRVIDFFWEVSRCSDVLC
jgi:hypothetical protein